MLEFLPTELLSALQNLNQKFLYEIRLRVGKPVMLRYRERYVYLARSGISERKSDGLIATQVDIDEAVRAAGKYSLYSVEDQIRQGFLTTDKGVRIGISGHYVSENGKILTVRDFTSLCIRVPHEVVGCGEEIYRIFLQKNLCNVLIVSSPGQGKTTILRDLSRILSEEGEKNVLICDERGEIAEGNVGDRTDVFSFAEKQAAIEIGIRVMRPDVIIMDELSARDFSFVLRAKYSGVHIIASLHGGSLDEVPQELSREFDVMVLLDSQKIGKISEAYDRKKNA